MTLRGFVFLLLVGVAASVASGLVVERFTAPGLERTLAFAAPVALVLYLAGLWGERRGWISGHARLGRRRTPGAAAAPTPDADGTATGATTPGMTEARAAEDRSAEARAARTGVAATGSPSDRAGAMASTGTDRFTGEPK